MTPTRTYQRLAAPGGLSGIARPGRIPNVAAKSAAGRGNPINKYKATQTPKASFFVSCHSAAIPDGQARPVSMVALVGQPKGWPVSLYAGISTPANVTTNKRGNLGGDSLHQYKEAATMATTPTPVTPKTFTFLVALHSARLADVQAARTVSTVAYSEAQARSLLGGLPLVFLSRCPAMEVLA